MAIVRLDWEKIKSRFDGRTQLFALTDQQAALLLSLSEQLTWDQTYRVEDYDFSDRDYLAAEVADTQRNLMVGVDLADLVGYIDDVETLLADLKTLTNNQCCPGDEFDGSGFTDPVEDGVGDVPANIISAGYASGTSDWAGFDDYKCIISHLIVEDAIGKALKFSQLFDIGGAIIGGGLAIIGIITFILTSGAIAILGGILAAAGASLTIWDKLTDAGEAGMENMHASMASQHDFFVCAVYEADGADAGIAALYAQYDLRLTAAEAVIAKLFNSLSMFRAMYGGRYDQVNVAQRLADLGYAPEDFDCTCELVIPPDYSLVPWVFGACTNPPACDVVDYDGNNVTWNLDTGVSAANTPGISTPADSVGFLMEFTGWPAGGSGYWRAGATNGDSLRFGYPSTGMYEPTVGAFLVGLNAPHAANWEDFIDDHPGSVAGPFANHLAHNVKNESVPNAYNAFGYSLWYIVDTS